MNQCKTQHLRLQQKFSWTCFANRPGRQSVRPHNRRLGANHAATVPTAVGAGELRVSNDLSRWIPCSQARSDPLYGI